MSASRLQNLLRTSVLLTLSQLLSPQRAEADGDWVDFRQVGRFYIFSEFPLDRLQAVDAFLDSLPRHESEVRTTLGLSRSDRPILIECFADRRSYRARLTRLAPESIRRRAVFLRADSSDSRVGRVCVSLHADLVTDLRHEVTHAILHSALPFLPLWLDEGLAEYFEVPPRQRASGHPHLQSVQRSIRLPLGRLSSLQHLEEKEQLSSISERDYRDAWAWTHFLLHGPPGHRRLLREYLQSIELNRPPGPVSARLRQVQANPTAGLTSHFRSWK